MAEHLKKIIRDVPDFPKEGILFKDITTLLKDPIALREVVSMMADLFRDKGITKVCGIESRGFIFGVPIALELEAGFVPIRKAGKLPAETLKQEYELEYGMDIIEIHKDAIEKGEKVLVVDDLVATGGTAAATAQLLGKMECDLVSFLFLVELDFLKGRDLLKEHNVVSILTY